MIFPRPVADDPRIDLTSMVDVVFLLLIFFMISTTFVESPGIDVSLPQSSTGAVEKTPKEVRVSVTSDGTIYYQDKALSLMELAASLAELRGSAHEITFLLMADKDARHGTVVEVMDLARETGFGKLAIGTERKRL